jgi:hypothetical protein
MDVTQIYARVLKNPYRYLGETPKNGRKQVFGPRRVWDNNPELKDICTYAQCQHLLLRIRKEVKNRSEEGRLLFHRFAEHTNDQSWLYGLFGVYRLASPETPLSTPEVEAPPPALKGSAMRSQKATLTFNGVRITLDKGSSIQMGEVTDLSSMSLTDIEGATIAFDSIVDGKMLGLTIRA